MTTIPAGVGTAAGWLLDRTLGEPPARIHPVAWFGTTMRRLEAATYRDSRLAGIGHLAAGTSIAVVTGLGLQRLLGRPGATAVATYIAVASRMLADEATAVLDAVEHDDLDTARDRLPTLVGRDVTELPATEIIRAVTESVAENTIDAVTAPLFWATVAGPVGVLTYRAVNTLDAMIGHHDQRYERFGWASARADDILNWLPARLGALGVAVLVPRRSRSVFRIVGRDASHHPSPNAGVIEAAFAAVLDIRLGGVNRYAGRSDDRGQLGAGPPPDLTDGHASIHLAQVLGAATAVTAAAVAWVTRSHVSKRAVDAAIPCGCSGQGE